MGENGRYDSNGEGEEEGGGVFVREAAVFISTH
jgi:hypothetical protein